jgi:hypothetical protein
MSEPSPVPLPQVLHKSRPHLEGSEKIADDGERISLLEDALEGARSYGETLWRRVDALRAYLLASLPPDPRVPGRHRSCASPTGPDDEQGWQRWIDAYAEASSALAGPHGDSGYGWRQAQHEAELRRTAPNIRLLSRHPELDQGAPAGNAAARRPTAATVLGIVTATLAAQHLLARRLRRAGP